MNAAPLSGLYAPSLALVTDFYQLTMAYGYWQQGLQDREAVFHLYFRKAPFPGGLRGGGGAGPGRGLGGKPAVFGR